MGHSPSRAMAAAQELYVRGEISYPRTDNTVYPLSLPVREILDRLRKSSYHDYVERLLARPELDPSRGPIHTTARPPIHPTAAPAKRREGMRATVYDMIARRFLATLSSPSLSTITEVHLRLGDTEFLAVGGVLVEPGWREILPDDRPMTELPALREGEELTVREVRVAEDRTTPPPLHTQGTLLLTMQRFALGTKSTRHEILDLLFRRQYISGRSIRTTAAGRALVDALTIYGPDVTDPEMTRHLEDRMTAIAEGPATLAEVADDSRRVTGGDARRSNGLLHHHAGLHHALDFARGHVLLVRVLHVHLRHLDDFVLVVALHHEATLALHHLHVHHVRRHRSTPPPHPRQDALG